MIQLSRSGSPALPEGRRSPAVGRLPSGDDVGADHHRRSTDEPERPGVAARPGDEIIHVGSVGRIVGEQECPVDPGAPGGRFQGRVIKRSAVSHDGFVEGRMPTLGFAGDDELGGTGRVRAQHRPVAVDEANPLVGCDQLDEVGVHRAARRTGVVGKQVDRDVAGGGTERLCPGIGQHRRVAQDSGWHRRLAFLKPQI